MDVTTPSVLRNLLDLCGNAQLMVFESTPVSFHPKSWIFHFASMDGLAIIGSSNMSETALRHGIEWNSRVLSSSDSKGWRDVQEGFDQLIIQPEVKELTNVWIDAYEQRRKFNDGNISSEIRLEKEPGMITPEPHEIQRQALEALRETRKNGYTAGLVVLATGLGKTWLSAFDSEKFERILFVAHREEILTQAMATFRRIRPNERFGRFSGSVKDLEADVLFASIQTLGRSVHLKNFSPDSFDYIIVDEFHHAAARTYKTLINYFKPKFMLGLTATPERTDGGDLLGLCQENLVFRCDMFRGIDEGLLSKFHYFGVPDNINYSQIPWRSSAFDEAELTKALATQARAENAYQQYLKHGGTKAIGFCCSRLHADFMADYFLKKGVRAVSLHSGETSSPRTTSLEQLQSGHLDILFSVDILNEGIDVPEVDTILMLRPTESIIIWLQQFGRGLRLSEDKERLRVVDYIGNHRIFLNKARALLQQEEGDRPLSLALRAIRNGEFRLPSGCEVTYELEALDLLQGLLRRTNHGDEIDAYYTDFKLRHGARPSAQEIFHAGFNPNQTGHSSWLDFVQNKGDLTLDQQEVFKRSKAFLDEVSTTRMTKSYKMLLLRAMLANKSLPGDISLDSLVDYFSEVSKRNPIISRDISVSSTDRRALGRLITDNPINALCRDEESFFIYSDNKLSTKFSIPGQYQEIFGDLVEEIIDWRMGQYLSRNNEFDNKDSSVESSEISNIISNKNNSSQIWHEYMRENIPALFGESFNTGKWNQGIILCDKNMILLVTLEKGNLSAGKIYNDYLIDANTFHWQSQTQTTQASIHGRIIKGLEPGYNIHLFLRRNKLRGNKASPFLYCGIVHAEKWENETPISVTWKLENSMPTHYTEIFISR